MIKIYWCPTNNIYFSDPDCSDSYHKRDSRRLTINMIIAIALNGITCIIRNTGK